MRLRLPTVQTKVDVPSDSPLGSDASSNQYTIRVSAQSLADLPILDEDYITNVSEPDGRRWVILGYRAQSIRGNSLHKLLTRVTSR
jgi:hypothetical protein